MRFRSLSLVLVPVLLAIAVSGVLAARRAGTASSEPPDLSTPGVKACPSGPPDACHELMAQLLDVDARDLPSIATTAGELRFRKGFVLISKMGSAPTAVMEYEASGGESEGQTFHVSFRVKSPPPRDDRPVGTTPGNRTFRIVKGDLGTLALVFNDEHLAYVVGLGVGGNLSQNPQDLARAKQIVDAVHLSTRQLNPKPAP